MTDNLLLDLLPVPERRRLLALCSPLPLVAGVHLAVQDETARELLFPVSGSLVLLTGLVIFGRDGKMLTYAALVVVLGTLAWWNRRR